MEEEINGVTEDNSSSEVPPLITEMKNTPAAVESRVGSLSGDTGIVSTQQVVADGSNPIKTEGSNDAQNISQVNAEEKNELDDSKEDTMMPEAEEEEKEEVNMEVAEETVSLAEEEDANNDDSEDKNESLLAAATAPVLEIVPVSASEDADETMDDQSDDTSAPDQNSIQSTDHTSSSDPMNIEIEEKDNIVEDNEEISSPFTLVDPILTPRSSPPRQPVEQTEHAMKLLSLPMDSLHCVASFLTASEWASFGQTSKNAAPVCREIFRKVRMHGFRCATEILAAFVSPIVFEARIFDARTHFPYNFTNFFHRNSANKQTHASFQHCILVLGCRCIHYRSAIPTTLSYCGWKLRRVKWKINRKTLRTKKRMNAVPWMHFMRNVMNQTRKPKLTPT